MTRTWFCGRVLAVCVAGVAACWSVLPAAADVTYSTSDGAGGTFLDVNAGDGHSFQLNGAYGGVLLGNTAIEAFWCVGSSTPDALDTTLQSCSLGGVPATSLVNYPGDVAVASGLAIVSSSNLTLCGSGFGSFAEGTLGATQLSASICTPAPTALPAIPDASGVVSDIDAVLENLQNTVNRILNPGCPEAGC